MEVARWFESLEKKRQKKARFWEKENLLKGPGIGWSFSFGYTPNLDEYVTDLTQPTPFFHQLVGREEEVGKIEEVLGRKGENNVLLVGPPGVGKQTIVLGFARLVHQGETRPQLAYKRVLRLELNRIIKKSALQESKEKLSSLLAEAIAAGHIILIIEEIDKFVSSGEGQVELIGIFSKAAASGRLQLIALASSEAFNKYLVGNEEFLKLFEKISVRPPSKEQALEILQAILPDFEQGKKVKVSYQALEKIIELSDRLITEIPFPEKAIDLLDQAISKFEEIKRKKLITSKDIDQLVSEKSGVPVGAISSGEEKKLVKIEESLHKRVVNQQEAIGRLASALRRSRLQVSSRKKPMGVFLFLGPTGVGKTETAKTLAQVYFGDESRLVRFDMGQYQRQESLERLIGSQTAGLGLLVSKAKDNPFSVFLLDELEKAHRRLLDIFLTVFDEGYLTDFQDRKVSFVDTIIIATSNAAGEFIREKVQAGVNKQELQSLTIEYIQSKGLFSPEFLNRFDGVVVFQPLGRKELEQIARLQLTKLALRLTKKDVILKFGPAVIKQVVLEGYSPEFGARSMKRVIADKIEDEIAKGMLGGRIRRGDEIEVEWEEREGEYLIKLKSKS